MDAEGQLLQLIQELRGDIARISEKQDEMNADIKEMQMEMKADMKTLGDTIVK